MHLHTGVWADKLQRQESKELFPPPHGREAETLMALGATRQASSLL